MSIENHKTPVTVPLTSTDLNVPRENLKFCAFISMMAMFVFMIFMGFIYKMMNESAPKEHVVGSLFIAICSTGFPTAFTFLYAFLRINAWIGYQERRLFEAERELREYEAKNP